METKTVGQKILYFPLTKIIIGLIVCIGTLVILKLGIEKLLGLFNLEKTTITLLSNTLSIFIVLFSYTTLYQYYEKRSITELSSKNLAKNLSLGIALGVGLQSLTIFVIYLYGGFSIISVNSFIPLIPSLIGFTAVAVFEEIVFRGIIFRITEEKLGSYIAMVISGLLFGFAHLFNPNSSITSALSIAIEAGLLFGAAYIYTRNLWFPIAMHFAWNFTQSNIFGAATSGSIIGKSLFTTKIEGSVLLTGGDFGPEASIQVIVFCVITTVILMKLNHKQNKVIKPYWSK
ncbi:CPBP family intramembrane glutamic endopeptidase [Flavobacterium sp.]|uniref:CPBP family intramembrane glutamic endopeptidase n=1 Tax=Flavobacterium sp. TaxID=239 RepID=UPI003750DE06